MIENDKIKISKSVFTKIVKIALESNDTLFIDKSYLNRINDKSINIVLTNDKTVTITINLNVKYGLNIKNNVKKLQKDIIEMIKHITDYQIIDININLKGIE